MKYFGDRSLNTEENCYTSCYVSQIKLRAPNTHQITIVETVFFCLWASQGNGERINIR